MLFSLSCLLLQNTLCNITGGEIIQTKTETTICQQLCWGNPCSHLRGDAMSEEGFQCLLKSCSGLYTLQTILVVLPLAKDSKSFMGPGYKGLSSPFGTWSHQGTTMRDAHPSKSFSSLFFHIRILVQCSDGHSQR